MSIFTGKLWFSILLSGVLLFAAAARIEAQHEHHSHDAPPAEKNAPVEKKASPDEKTPDALKNAAAEEKTAVVSITLAQLEEMALRYNPTLKRAELAVRAAEGRRTQAGLLPNPVVGVAADDLAFRDFGGKVGFFVEQKIPLGGKLAKNRRVFEQEIMRAETEKLSQRARVLNSVRLLYAEALAAQRINDLRKDLLKLADENVEVAGELYNVGLADRPDRLRIEIGRERAEAEYVAAANRYEAARQKLGAMIGMPEMAPARLAETSPELTPEIDAGALLADLLSASPEIKAARIEVERTRAALKRARAEKIPDLYLRGGVAYNRELKEVGGALKRSGAEGFLEVGVELPVFNRNQGGIKTAEAELAIAEAEVERLQLVLRTKFAEVLKYYRNAAFLAERYRTVIVPKARAAYEMYAANFASMSAAYTNVLETRAAYLRAQIEYARRLGEAQRALALLKNFLLADGLNAPAGSQESASAEREALTENSGGDDEDR